MSQLSVGGRMICPLNRSGKQFLICIDKSEDKSMKVDIVMTIEQ